MMDSNRSAGEVVVQDFMTEADATEAMQALRDAGFTDDQIRVIARDGTTADNVSPGSVGLPDLASLGLGAEQAQIMAESLDAGNVLVAVVAGDRAGEVRSLLGVSSVGGGDDPVILTPGSDSTGNTILDESIGATAGVTPSIDTLLGEEDGAGYERIDGKDDETVV